MLNLHCNKNGKKINKYKNYAITEIRTQAYGENLIARCSQVHDNFTMGVNRKILINLIYLFIQKTYLTCANGL